MDLALVAALVAFAAIVGVALQLSAKRKREAQRAADGELRAWAQRAIEIMESAGGDISKLPDINAQVRGLILHRGERCFAAVQDAAHVTEAHRTRYVGGSQGVSFRIAKGVRYHVGGFSGHPVTTNYEKVADVGDLYVTSERVVFAGAREATSIAGNKVADVRIEGDHLWVIAENRKTPLGLRLTPAVAPVMAYAVRLLAEASQR